MKEERNPWDQMIEEGEPSLWFGRFTTYRNMGTRRSVNAVYAKENNKKQQKTTTFPGPTWYEAAKTWKWEERAKTWDAYRIAEEDKVIAEERNKVLRSGFALMHKRVKELDKLTRKLIKMTDEEDKVWIPDVKAIGNGPTAERVDLVNFNAPLFTLIDKYLASIAAEMGERIKKTEVTGKDGGPIEIEETVVETFWGRGTDPRKRSEEKDEVEDTQQVQCEDEEETEVSVEFGKDDEEE